MYLLYACMLLFLLLLIYMVIIEPGRLTATHYFIRKSKKTVLDVTDAVDMYQGKTSITLAQLSDLHFSRWYPPRRLNGIIRQLLKTKPDMVIFTGDLIDDYSKWPHKKTTALVEKLKKIPAPMGKIAILGNHDYQHNGHYFVKEVLKKAGFTVLTNDQIFFSNQQVSLTIVGLDDDLFGQPSYEFEDTLAEWHLLLTHEPDSIEKFPLIHHFDLVLAGHSHGGQIRLPFYRKRTLGSMKYTHGLYLVTDQTLLSVNTGIGMTTLPARLGVAPEITYYHLEKEDKAATLISLDSASSKTTGP